MKLKFQNLSLLLISGIVVFSSCKKDEEAPAKVLPTAFTAKLLGAQGNSAGSFFSPKTGLVYLTGDSATFIANAVDISFAQTGAPTSPKFISLAERRNQGLTRVVTLTRGTNFSLSTLTKAQFDTVGNVFVSNKVGGSTSTAIVQQGKVYEFTNAEAKNGLIYISNLDLGTGTNGSVTIDVKFEK